LEGEEKVTPQVGVRIIKSAEPMDPAYDVIAKAETPQQLSEVEKVNSAEWIQHVIDQRGLKELVQHSTVLPQCIRAYKNNICGFGIGVRYADDYKEETEAMIAEYTNAERIINLLNIDMQTKEVFENIIESRETFGIAYLEVIRNAADEVVQIEHIIDTPTIEMTYPLAPYVDTTYFYKGEVISRKRKFRKYRQTVGGKTVYFKEFGDPRVMDKNTGRYADEETGEVIALDDRANEILDFQLGTEYYGEVRWIGQVLTVDGTRRAEVLNNNYFRKGRHTPLMIVVKGGTLTDDSFTKLQTYMNSIQGENGQHAFLVLETENSDTRADFSDTKQPEIEIKDLAAILQKDELFQEYLNNGRKKIQSSFLLPDLYVGYTTDFNRATAQTAMEVTEKQVFQPERISLAWVINNKLLNGYGFKYVEAYFEEPDITNPDDIFKILNVTERAGGLPPNTAKELTFKTLGKDAEDYPDEWGNIPLQYLKSLPQQPVTPDLVNQVDAQIQKAANKKEDEVLAVMKEVRKLLVNMSEGGK
jgi:PBSX family phage portal protein